MEVCINCGSQYCKDTYTCCPNCGHVNREEHPGQMKMFIVDGVLTA